MLQLWKDIMVLNIVNNSDNVLKKNIDLETNYIIEIVIFHLNKGQ